MVSLRIKILGLVTAISLTAVVLTTWNNLRNQRDLALQLASRHSQVLAETVCSTITTTMAAGLHQEAIGILEKIKNQPAIQAIRIFNETGRILISPDPEEVGRSVSAEDLQALRNARFAFQEFHQGNDIFCSLTPILNGPDCFRCHQNDRDILGILQVHVSLKELKHFRSAAEKATLFSSGGMLLALVLTLSVFTLVYVDRPIRQLVKAMMRVESGDFSGAHTHIGTSREMAFLSEKFNRMLGKLRELVDQTVIHERQMAVQEEKLAHHEEIRTMNATLEERLREIEYLNISLEERIEEIEEANFKIADLAADLESKNRHLETAVNRLQGLYRMGLAINGTMNLDNLFSLLVRKTLEVLDARIGYILLLDKDHRWLRIGEAQGVPGHIDPGMRIPLREGGASHWVVTHEAPLLVPRVAEAHEFNKTSSLGFTRETLICAPLTVRDEIIGTITMANRIDRTPFRREDLELLSTIAAQASVAIKNAQLYQDQEKLYLSTVQALVSAIEASDSYTRGHSERVTRYSLAAARALGLPKLNLRNLEQAAILHDIGKIGIDVGLLHKEGVLSESDVDRLHQHPLIGVRILEPIEFLATVRTIIAQHHERFDGTGYPLGLAGERLTLEARILAVADTFDAMTSDRPYRAAISRESALDEIRRQAGSQFDPVVVDAFWSLFTDNNRDPAGSRHN